MKIEVDAGGEICFCASKMKTTFLPYTKNGSRFVYIDGEKTCIGSQMGRRDYIPDDFETVEKLHLRNVKLNSGYDAGGAYWGWGEGVPLFCAWGYSETEQAEFYFRAKNRDSAKEIALKKFPNARFYK